MVFVGSVDYGVYGVHAGSGKLAWLHNTTGPSSVTRVPLRYPFVWLNGAYRVPLRSLLYGFKKRGTKRVLEYARLAMGCASVRASRYGIR